MVFRLQRYDLLEALNQGEMVASDDELTVWRFTCPVCRHPSEAEIPRQPIPLPGDTAAIIGQTDPSNDPAAGASPGAMLIECRCTHEHEGQPDGELGCGAHDNINVNVHTS